MSTPRTRILRTHTFTLTLICLLGPFAAAGDQGPLFPVQLLRTNALPSGGDGTESVASADMDGDGSLDLVVGDSDSILVFSGLGDGTFALLTEVTPAGPVVSDLALADVDGDADVDLATSSPGGVAVYLNDGQGVLSLTKTLASSASNAVAFADLDGDGNPDLVFTNSTSSSVSSALGAGNGQFAPAQGFPSGAANPQDLALGDVTGDGLLDVLVAHQGGSFSLGLLAGLGDGGFAPAVAWAAGGGLAAVDLGDVDGDGDLDLALANLPANSATILLNDGAGNLGASTTLPVTGGAAWQPTLENDVALRDLDGDGALDLLVVNGGTRSISVFLGQGDGGWSAESAFPVGQIPRQLTCGDVNGDGVLDVAVANKAAESVSILPGLGDGSLARPAAWPAGSAPFALRHGDLDGDGVPDLLLTNLSLDQVTPLLGQGDGGFVAGAPTSVGSAPIGLALADLDADGALDLASANSGGGDVSVRLGQGDGSFGSETRYATGTDPRRVETLDVDGDGTLDLIVVNRLSGTVSILPGTGVGTFGAPTQVPTGITPGDLALSDVDGDGDLDLALADELGGSASIAILLADGGGGFGASGPASLGIPASSVRGVAAGDLDGDGDDDLVAVSTSVAETASLSVLANDGTGSYAPQPASLLPNISDQVALCDLDGDGALDVVLPVSGGFDDLLLVARGDGLGGLAPAETFAAGLDPLRIELADYDGDGRQDVALTNFNDGEVSVLRQGNGIVQPSPFVDLGHALAGVFGEPTLAGEGPLTASSTLGLMLGNAAANTPVTLVFGLSALNLPFKGGVLVPSPDFLFDGLNTDVTGSFSLSATWPAGVPSGFELFWQFWIVDPTGPHGLTASNGLQGTTP